MFVMYLHSFFPSELYVDGKIIELTSFVSDNISAFESDENLGLVKQCQTAIVRKKIQVVNALLK